MKKFLLALLSLIIGFSVCLAGCSNEKPKEENYANTRIAESDESGAQSPEEPSDKFEEPECPDGKCGKKKMPRPERGKDGKRPAGEDFKHRRRHGRKPPKNEDLPNEEKAD